MAVDFGGLDDRTARQLLQQYLPVVRALCRLYPTHLRDDLDAVGRVAILEAYVRHEPSRSAQASWVRWLVRRRLAAHAQQLRTAELPLEQEPAAAELPAAETFALQQLSVEQREIVVAHAARGETFRQLGKRLGVRPQTVHRRYHAAIVQLQAKAAEAASQGVAPTTALPGP